VTHGADSIALRRRAAGVVGGTAAVVLVGAAIATPAVPGGPGGVDELVELLLTLFAVMVSAAAAVLAAVSARLSPSRRMTELALLLGGYGLLVLPLTSGPLHRVAAAGLDALLLLGWAVVAGGGLVVAPRRGGGFLAVGSGGALLGVAHARHGLGLLLGSKPDVLVAGLRLLGLLLLGAGVIVLARCAQRAVQRRRGELARRLAVAASTRIQLADRAAHRDHEIRASLSSLSGISQLVRASARVRDRERLRVAVEGELTRLEAILTSEADPWLRDRGPGTG
jgi:hypothetical protein